jgi:hypothetical protein
MQPNLMRRTTLQRRHFRGGTAAYNYTTAKTIFLTEDT